MFELKQFFCFADPTFFDDVSRWNAGPGFLPDRDFTVAGLPTPAGWSRREQRIWVSLRPDGYELPEQGWKIHISATLDNADRLCGLVWDYCVQRRIPFKHLRDRNMLLALNAKYAARGSSGKLITIYPADDEQFSTIVTDLAKLTEGESGPYILSDLRIGDGPVYVRYGAFVQMDCLDANGEWVSGFRLPDGTIEPDQRQAFFSPPAWAPVPAVLTPHIEARRSGSAQPAPYRVRRALHFSNAGGIYVADRVADGRTVILKEARPYAGLDDNHEDGVTRQRREKWALEKLAGIPGVPELYEQFEVGGHHFLAEEYVDGQPLHVWYGVHHPWVIKADPTQAEIAEYTRRAVHIVEQVETLVDAMHERGVVFGDLHLGNIMVKPDDSVALVDFELAFDSADTDWRPGLRATGFGRRDKSGVDVDRYALASVKLAIFLTLSRISVLEPGKVFHFVRILTDNFPVPDGWAESILDQLASPETTTTGAAPAESPIDYDALLADSTSAAKSITEAILGSATPDRQDRLFPGAVEQFAPGGGLNFAYGAAGVLWTLAVTGHGRYPEHERWLLDRVRDLPRCRPGFYDGIAGLAYTLDHLGYAEEADDLVDRHLADTANRHGISFFSGLPGIGATLLHFAQSRDDRGLREEAITVATRLADAVRHDDPGRVLVRPRKPNAKPVEAGAMRGWSGVALYLIRLYEETADPGYLDLAVQAVHRDLDRCVTNDDGSLMVEEAGVRTMPYLEVGAAGIALVIDELLEHREDDRARESLPALLLGSCRRYAIQADLFRGYASQIATLARLNHRVDHRDVLRRHLRELSWHALSYRGQLAFPGSLGFRLSMDLVTGSAGILLAISAATQDPPPFLPFFSPTRMERDQ
nr:class III lanthionine synthetase LanKC [Micromonospora sp. DSM 115978]